MSSTDKQLKALYRLEKRREMLATTIAISPLCAAVVLLTWIEHFPAQVFHLLGSYLIVFTATGTAAVYLWLRSQIKSQLLLVFLILPGSAFYIAAIGYTSAVALNILFLPQQEIVYQGIIQEKLLKPRGTRQASDKYYILLNIQDEYGIQLKIPVTERTYQRLQVGMNYQHSMTRGGLGCAYRLLW